MSSCTNHEYFLRAKRYAKKTSFRSKGKVGAVVGTIENSKDLCVCEANYLLKAGEKILAYFENGIEINISTKK